MCYHSSESCDLINTNSPAIGSPKSVAWLKLEELKVSIAARKPGSEGEGMGGRSV